MGFAGILYVENLKRKRPCSKIFLNYNYNSGEIQEILIAIRLGHILETAECNKKNKEPFGFLAFMCPGLDSNQHTLASTSPSSWRVYQFHHLGMINLFYFN